MIADEVYMRRALQLAANGAGFASPNPMVGAVVLDTSGRIIGEGWHRKWGEPHAEVNAIASVKHRELLAESTVYVTLEPCSHYGKTPPCAKLLIDNKVKRVVVGVADPFVKVSGRGISMLRDAGIEVSVGVLEEECWRLNRRFMTAHTQGRAYVLLKWAESADGFMAGPGGKPVALSSELTRVLMHRERAGVDAILVGSGTVIADNPSLTCRLWPSRKLIPVVLDRRHRVDSRYNVVGNPDLLLIDSDTEPLDLVRRLYTDHGITSVMVEGGASVLQSFIDAGVYDEVRIEESPILLGGGVKAPEFDTTGCREEVIDGRKIRTLDREIRNYLDHPAVC